MTILDTLKARGLLDNIANTGLEERLEKGPLTFYVGFDPTATSFHVGQLVVFNFMHLLQQAGHTPIALMGGATGMVGDPGGKSKERNLLRTEEIEQNIAGQRQQLERFLNFSGSHPAKIMNNMDWLSQWSYLDFLRDVGKHFSVNQMMMRDTVKSRLSREGDGISYTEFSYMLLQAYDYYYLCQHKECILQLGGSDQWGNILSGIDLCRRLLQKDCHGLTMPLLTKSDGTKFGKSEAGAIWLDANKTSPYDFYQFFLRTEDADVSRFLRMLTDIELVEIDELVATLQDEAHLRKPQTRLAAYLTERVHGKANLERVLQATKAMYGGAITDLDDQTIQSIFKDVPTCNITQAELKAGWPLIEALVASEACDSKSAARRLIGSGGVYVNNQRIEEEDLILDSAYLASASYLVLRTGKRNYRLVVVSD